MDTLIVKWDHEYHLCRNFTVYLNDEAVPECTDIKIMNCTIGNLEAGVTYKVTVNATETGTEPITISRLISTMAVGMPIYSILHLSCKTEFDSSVVYLLNILFFM